MDPWRAGSPSRSLDSTSLGAPAWRGTRGAGGGDPERDPGRLGYAIVTPARDEVADIRRLAGSLARQTAPPTYWVIVDNGSTDGTLAAARAIARGMPCAIVCTVDGSPMLERGAPIVRAFHAGLDALPDRVDVVVKLDADVSVATNFFEELLARFRVEPQLGIAGGTCYEQDDKGAWRPKRSAGLGVRGACRAYRAECLAEMLPLEERLGWDTIDVATAAVRGWRTLVCEELPFFHHRAEAARERTERERWAAQGEAAHYMGYRPLYLLLRALFRGTANPRALWLLEGYMGAAVRRKPRLQNADVVRFLRRQQSLRRLPTRIRQKTGRRGHLRAGIPLSLLGGVQQ